MSEIWKWRSDYEASDPATASDVAAACQALFQAASATPQLMMVAPRSMLAIVGMNAYAAAIERYDAEAERWDRRRRKKAAAKAEKAARTSYRVEHNLR